MRPITALRWGALILVPCLASVAGCGHPAMRIEQLSKGYIVMLPGVESSGWQFSGTAQGLHDAGVERAIDVVEWGDRATESFANLMDLRRNQERATSIAFRIAGYQRSYPDAPVTLIGYSGGGGLAVLVAEALADDVQLERLVLIGAAIAPDHDLGKASSHCRHGIVNFYSDRDWFMLGVGTRTFGTIDRKKTDSAGRVGFKLASGELLTEPNLTQIPWRQDWAALGHNGSHVGWLAREWARDVLAPVIKEGSNHRFAAGQLVEAAAGEAPDHRKPHFVY